MRRLRHQPSIFSSIRAREIQGRSSTVRATEAYFKAKFQRLLLYIPSMTQWPNWQSELHCRGFEFDAAFYESAYRALKGFIKQSHLESYEKVKRLEENYQVERQRLFEQSLNQEFFGDWVPQSATALHYDTEFFDYLNRQLRALSETDPDRSRWFRLLAYPGALPSDLGDEMLQPTWDYIWGLIQNIFSDGSDEGLLNGAIQFNQLDVLKANLTAAISQKTMACLFEQAVKLGRIQVIQLFLERGVDINIAVAGGFSALDSALLKGNHCMVRFLLEKGAQCALDNLALLFDDGPLSIDQRLIDQRLRAESVLKGELELSLTEAWKEYPGLFRGAVIALGNTRELDVQRLKDEPALLDCDPELRNYVEQCESLELEIQALRV